MSKILQIKQSPLNVLQWCCVLECGHDRWITAKHRPTRKKIACYQCDQNAAAYHGDVDGDCSL